MFTNCFVKDLSGAASSTKHPAKEDAASGISRYIIEYWDDKKAGWMSCFNGMGIGGEFIAAIVPRTTSKARPRVLANSKDKALITAFEASNDPLGDPLNVAKGTATPNRTGKEASGAVGPSRPPATGGPC